MSSRHYSPWIPPSVTSCYLKNVLFPPRVCVFHHCEECHQEAIHKTSLNKVESYFWLAGVTGIKWNRYWHQNKGDNIYNLKSDVQLNLQYLYFPKSKSWHWSLITKHHEWWKMPLVLYYFNVHYNFGFEGAPYQRSVQMKEVTVC